MRSLSLAGSALLSVLFGVVLASVWISDFWKISTLALLGLIGVLLIFLSIFPREVDFGVSPFAVVVRVSVALIWFVCLLSVSLWAILVAAGVGVWQTFPPIVLAGVLLPISVFLWFLDGRALKNAEKN
ncbi:hypothetical protein ABZ234_26630 [Nocardiopsis sp. NPDC006198]|uniref:hypothetical protein n=1 Tax=Nocardiopsis sp. NPDC006198 TaxID=3154472 RepID=UPI0033B6CA08